MKHISQLNRANIALGHRFVLPALRRGLSLLELLTVIGLIAILMAILIPAVQSVRQSAHALECRNQLRQIIIAVQNYESTFTVFPTRQFLTEVQPYLEIPEPQRVVPLFACPSDRRHANGDIVACRFSYALNAGLNADEPEYQGVAGLNGRRKRASEITDGLSNTAFVGEKLSFPWYAPQAVAWDENKNDWNRTFLFFEGKANNPIEFSSLCSTKSVRPHPTWFFTHAYHHLMVPNSRSCIRVDAEGAIVAGRFGLGVMAGSVHPSGTHCAFSDGAVTFVSSDVDAAVWRAQGTASGGEAF